MTKKFDKNGQGHEPNRSPLPAANRAQSEGVRSKRLAAVDRLRGRIGREHR